MPSINLQEIEDNEKKHNISNNGKLSLTLGAVNIVS